MNNTSTGHQSIVQNVHPNHGHNQHRSPPWPFSLPQTHPMWWQTYICQHAKNTTTSQLKCTHILQPLWREKDILASWCRTTSTLHAMATTSSFPTTEACILMSQPAQWPCFMPNSKHNNKNLKKAHDTALAMQMLLWNLLIDAIPNDYLMEFWDPEKRVQLEHFLPHHLPHNWSLHPYHQNHDWWQ